jgi:hypothetical protein
MRRVTLPPRLFTRPARATVYYASWLGLTLLILLWRLSSIKLSPLEQAARNGSSLTSLRHDLLFAPWRIVEDISVHISPHSVWLQRLPSVLFSLVILLAFYYCLKVWLGNQVAVLTTALFLTTPVFLLASRLGLTDVLYFWPITTLAAYLYFRRSDYSTLAAATLVLSLVVDFYIPGLLWLFLIIAAFKYRSLAGLVEQLDFRQKLWLGLGWLALLLPLIFNLVTQPHIWQTYFLLPAHVGSVLTVAKNWFWAIGSLFVKSHHHSYLSLGRTAILDIAQLGLALFGAYALYERLTANFYMLVALLAAATFLAGLSGNVAFLDVCVLPVLVLAGFGLRYLYLEWQHTFPRNPLPRYFAYFLMAAVVTIHIIYGVRYALIAWPLA